MSRLTYLLSKEPELKLDKVAQQVLAVYGWRNVEDNVDMLPTVCDFPPHEWIHLVTMSERALLAAAFTDLVHAARRVDHIDASRPSSSLSRMETDDVDKYVKARAKVQEVGGKVARWISTVLSKTFPFDPGGCKANRLPQLTCCSLSSLAATKVRRKHRNRKVVDICSGQQSLARYLLTHDSTAEVLSIDILPYEQALAQLPSHVHHRVKYVQMDVSTLTLEELRRLVRQHLQCELSMLYAVHFSPCCKSYSNADAGRSGYRMPNGAPNPTPRNNDGTVNVNRYHYACMWDDIVRSVLDILTQLTEVNPTVLLSVENPTAMFRLHPSVVERISDSRSKWRLVEVDYCKTADPEFDGDTVYTMKPTDLLLYGVRGPSDFTLPRCNRDCRFRFPDHTGKSYFHLRSIRLDKKSVPGQTKQQGYLRHAIPCTLFHMLFEEHDTWVVSHLDTSKFFVVMADSPPVEINIAVSTRASKRHKTPVVTGDTSGPTSSVSPHATSTIRPDPSTKTKRNPVVIESHKQSDGPLSRGQKLYLLLHYRFGHASLKRLKALFPYLDILSKKNKVECSVCLAAKATPRPHIGKLLRMSYALGLVIFDIQGPFRIKDIDGHLYSLVLIDDYTDMKWMYRLKTKDQLGSTLRLWIAALGVCPERLRMDGAGENIGMNGVNSVMQLCYERCIYPERTVPYQSQQMSRVERVHRTFLEAARCLLITTPGATLDLWGYAYMHVCYLDKFLGSNGPHSTPYYRWHGEEPSSELLNSIRIWGSIVYFTHNDNRHKLEPPGHRGMFLGISSMTDGVYVRDLDHPQQPVRVTRDDLDRSYNEGQCLFREPLAVDFDEYRLLEHEPERKELGDVQDLPWESVLFEKNLVVEKDLQQYYKAFQAFAKDRRLLLSSNANHSPAHIEKTIKAEWRKLQFDSAKAQIAARQAEQRTAETQAALKDSGGEATSSDAEHSTIDASSNSTNSGGKRSWSSVDNSANKSNKVPKRSSSSASTHKYMPGKYSSDVTDIPCAKCGVSEPQHGNILIACDGCNRGYHTKCFKISVVPRDEDDWLCHACIQPGMRISVHSKVDRQWRDGTVRLQLPNGAGTEVNYDDGTRALENLYAVQWKPLYERNLCHLVALVEDESFSEANVNIWLATTPKSLSHLKRFPQSVQRRWQASRLKEFKSIVGKGAVEIVDRSELPSNAIVIPSAWVFKIKSDGLLKSRLVLLGHLMPKSDEIDVASPTPRLSSLRLILKICITLGLACHIYDIDTAFTYAKPHTTIYCSIPGGLYDDGRLEGKFFHMLRNLYGADSAPRMFHNLLHNWFVADGFMVNPHDPCLYYRWIDGVPVFAICWVDDLTLVSTPDLLADLGKRLGNMFALKDLGPLGLNPDGSSSMLLGIEIRRTDDEFQLRQTKLIDTLVAKAGTELNSIPHEKVPIRDIRLSRETSPSTPADIARWKARPYRSYLGVCGYLMLATMPHIAFAYKELSRFNDCYGKEHWDALLRLIAYLKKNRDEVYFCISRHGGMSLSGYCDSDWNGSDLCTSSTGYIFFCGFTPLAYASRLQRCTARSTGEAEFIALSAAAQEAVYLQMLMASLRIPPSVLEIYCNDVSRYAADGSERTDKFKTAVQIWSDSRVAIAQAKKPDAWIVDKLRHVKTAYFFFKSYVRDSLLSLMPCSGTDNPSDIMTKGFGAPGNTANNQKADVFNRHALFCCGRRVHKPAEKLK